MVISSSPARSNDQSLPDASCSTTSSGLARGTGLISARDIVTRRLQDRIAKGHTRDATGCFPRATAFCRSSTRPDGIDPTKTNHLTIRIYPLGFFAPKRELRSFVDRL